MRRYKTANIVLAENTILSEPIQRVPIAILTNRQILLVALEVWNFNALLLLFISWGSKTLLGLQVGSKGFPADHISVHVTVFYLEVTLNVWLFE